MTLVADANNRCGAHVTGFLGEVIRNKPVAVQADGNGLTPILEASCPKQRAMFAKVRHEQQGSAAPQEVNTTRATLRRVRGQRRFGRRPAPTTSNGGPNCRCICARFFGKSPEKDIDSAKRMLSIDSMMSIVPTFHRRSSDRPATAN